MPASLSAVQISLGGASEYVGTRYRLSTLQGACLIWGCYRCVISRKFDSAEAEECVKRNGGSDNRDKHGTLIQQQPFDHHEVAQILLHSLMKSPIPN
ncbi:hypothetical protein EMCG_08280 [[Emmonsia] crescens]|uniref:Uncharacterized protein n=1 Tax=[Emmonsia] crescens TaxID=73230 RepID=A0A0G2JAM4_9EURO|nr:hypothetical protein EMCG_08280 [Emmonsia crescens UAMH 3008]